jgi:hypothetical protein
LCEDRNEKRFRGIAFIDEKHYKVNTKIYTNRYKTQTKARDSHCPDAPRDAGDNTAWLEMKAGHPGPPL